MTEVKKLWNPECTKYLYYDIDNLRLAHKCIPITGVCEFYIHKREFHLTSQFNYIKVFELSPAILLSNGKTDLWIGLK